MQKEEIRQQTAGIFRKVLKMKEDPVDSTSSSDVDGWDSLNHVVLISEIEKHFNLKFELEEILAMQDFGSICARVSEKSEK